MVLLRQEQVKDKVNKAVERTGAELTKYKEIITAPNRSVTSEGFNLLSDVYSLDFLRPQTVGKRFTAQEMYTKIRNSFKQEDLDNIDFEFAIEKTNPQAIERQSGNYAAALLDTINNYTRGVAIISPSGSAAENIAFNETLTVVAVNYKSFALQTLKWRFVTAILFSLIILAAFYLTVRTMLQQKKLGEIKNDFINNMTHEFKTPIATISLAVDAMRNEKVIHDRDKMGYFSGIIKEENQRMNRQVETILRASQLEKQEVDLNLKPVHVHELIKDVVDNFTLQLESKEGKVEMNLDAHNDLIKADEVHFSNLVNNLVDNAVKYSKENVPPLIKLTTYSNGKNFIMKIEDNGIGMNRDNLKRIFEKFYRVHTGNLHNVKGFGLGLSYVKTMVEAHHGDIKAESTPGKGSTFIIDLPLNSI